MTTLICPECSEPMYVDPSAGYWETLVGYCSPPGHDHNDNCLKTVVVCSNGHQLRVSKRRRCNAEGCDWVGKEECFCHPGKKLDEWPVRPKGNKD
jgi:hypothetical protein